jgi:O-antigen ligase
MEKWGKWLIPFFFAMVPWDISKVLFPPYQSAPQTPTTLTFVRIATILLIIWGATLLTRRGSLGAFFRLSKSMLTWGALALLIAGLISAFGSLNPHATLVEGVRLLVFIALSMSIALGATLSPELDLESLLERVWQTIFIMATVVALFGIVQYITGWGIWGGAIAPGPRRINSTFMDSNILARYLDISIIGTTILILMGQWQLKLGILFGLLCQLAALIFTYSRMAWLILLAGIIILVVLSSNKNRWKYLGLIGVGMGALWFIPAVRLRILPLLNGQDPTIGVRQYLIEGGWAMFIEHPFTGVGLGNFQWAIEHPYSYILPYIGVVSRSHTTLVTVAAEMGILGLLAMFIFLATLLIQNLRVSGVTRNYLLAMTAGVIVIWFSSQGEGRFFEDPLLWDFWGLSLAVAKQDHLGWLVNLLEDRRNK